MQNFDWLEEKLGDVDDDYILFDCPGVLWNNLTNYLDINNVVVTKLLDRFPVVLISIPLSSEWGLEPPFPKQGLAIEPTLPSEGKYYLPIQTEKGTCVAK